MLAWHVVLYNHIEIPISPSFLVIFWLSPEQPTRESLHTEEHAASWQHVQLADASMKVLVCKTNREKGEKTALN